jgi:hypothetical protein
MCETTEAIQSARKTGYASGAREEFLITIVRAL